MPPVAFQTLKRFFSSSAVTRNDSFKKKLLNQPTEDEPFQQTLYPASLVQNIITHFESNHQSSCQYHLCIVYSVEGGKRSVYQQCNLESSAASPDIICNAWFVRFKGKNKCVIKKAFGFAQAELAFIQKCV